MPSQPPHPMYLHGRVAARLETQGADILLLVPIHGQEAERLLGGVRHDA